MRLLKKFNQYMLENHPLTWHSKFIQLLAAGLLFWLISFLCGYLMVDLNVIKYETLSRFYFRSNFISFHVIYCLIVICFWAIYFYKNNVIKSFYPLQRFYLVRIFLQLFIAFTSLVSADLPFTLGCYTKSNQILPQESFERDMEKVNIGSVFLVRDDQLSAYHFTRRKDYQALDYDFIRFNEEKNKWNESFEYYYYPEMADEPYVPKNLPYRNFVAQSDSLISFIDGNKYLFFTSLKKYSSADSCYSYQLVDEIHKLELEGLHTHDFKNYNGEGFEAISPGSRAYFQSNYIPKIHRWTADNQKDSIRKSIADLVGVMEKYKLNANINPALISTYLEAKNYRDLQGFVTNYGSGDHFFKQKYPQHHAMIQKYSDGRKVSDEDVSAFIEAVEKQDYLGFGVSSLENVINNYHDSNDPMRLLNGLMWLLFLSFFMAWLFLFFEFAHIISLLISIPIGGVLAILIGIAMIYINLFLVRMDMSSYENYDYHKGEKISAAIIFGVCLVIVGITLFGLYKKRFSKRVLNVLINLTYVISPFFISLLLVMLNTFSGHNVYQKCDSSIYKYSYSFLVDSAGLNLLYAFIGVFAIFPLIIKWRAKEE